MADIVDIGVGTDSFKTLVAAVQAANLGVLAAFGDANRKGRSLKDTERGIP